MRILVVQESNWIDRGPHQSHHIMERMVVRGHEVRVIDFNIVWRQEKPRKLLSPRSVITAPPKAIPGGEIAVIRPLIVQLPVIEYISLLITHRNEIIAQLNEYKPDVVIGFGILNARMAISLCHKRKIPFIYYIIDELHRLVPQLQLQKIARFIESSNMKKADIILSINEGLREYSVLMGAPKEKTQIIRAGVDIEWLNRANRKQKREDLGFVDSDCVLFFMGWLYDFSGLREVAEALLYTNEDPRIKLLIVGNGDLWDFLQSIRKKPGMAKKIVTVGWQPYNSMPDYLAAADICILPAYNNDIMRNIVPIKMYEYMAAGKPVIATNLPGIKKEFGIDNGVIFIDTPNELIKTVKDMIEPIVRNEHGLRSRHFIEGNDWNVIIDQFEKTMRSVINDH